MMELLESLAKLSPLVAALVIFIYYLYHKNKQLEETIVKKDDDIKELNEYIRQNDKSTQQVLSQVSNTLDKVLDDQKHNVDDIKNHISMLMMMKNKDN